MLTSQDRRSRSVLEIGAEDVKDLLNDQNSTTHWSDRDMKPPKLEKELYHHCHLRVQPNLNIHTPKAVTVLATTVPVT